MTVTLKLSGTSAAGDLDTVAGAGLVALPALTWQAVLADESMPSQMIVAKVEISVNVEPPPP